MNEVMAPESHLPVAEPNAGNLMQVIARAASDPTVDVNKLERLMEMAERIHAREAKDSYSVAMMQAQESMKPVAQDAANTSTKSKYASFVRLDLALRPIYTTHGFSISYTTGKPPEPLMVRVVARVKHKDGHEETHKLDIPADGKGAKGGDVMTRTHAAMSAITYGRRGLLKMIFNIAEGESDDDGNGASGPVTDEQQFTIEQLLRDTGSDVGKFLKSFGYETVEGIPAKDYARVKRALEAKKTLLGAMPA